MRPTDAHPRSEPLTDTIASSHYRLTFTDLPTRTVPDWEATAELLRRVGHLVARPTIPANSGHACLHKHGFGVYAIRIGGKLVAYSLEPLRKPAAKKAT